MHISGSALSKPPAVQNLKWARYTIILSNLFNLFSGRKCRPTYTYPYAWIDLLDTAASALQEACWVQNIKCAL